MIFVLRNRQPRLSSEADGGVVGAEAVVVAALGDLQKEAVGENPGIDLEVQPQAGPTLGARSNGDEYAGIVRRAGHEYTLCTAGLVSGLRHGRSDYLQHQPLPLDTLAGVVETAVTRIQRPMIMPLQNPALDLLDSGTPSAASNPQRAMVEELASRKIRGFRGTIGENGEYLDEVYQSNASLTASIATDYRDRFLIELIQNAYDAHPVEARGGRIEITLDLRNGTKGSLFAANTGQAFTDDNVKDLCNIGLSRKPLGESIGNKGLGFRSVVQITDTPMIYSQHPSAPGQSSFSGFCFRFAGSEDYAALIDDPRHYELAHRDLPIFHIPVWLDEQSDAVRSYAANTFSTLINLPLRDSAAQDAVRREMEELRNQQAPMLLFLDRVESLEFRIVSPAGDIEEQFTFSRSEEKKLFKDLELSRVELGRAGSFLVARRAVAETKMQDSIGESIARKELSEHWARWTGDGDVALAVRLDTPVKAPRLYTYLPMGEQAVAPLAGHLHGSFFPSSNRKYLNARNRLNAMLLGEATILAAQAIRHIVADPSGQISAWLTHDERATTVGDLLSWEKVGSLETDEDLAGSVALQIATAFGCGDFKDAPVVPCTQSKLAGTRMAWKPPGSARLWRKESGLFSSAAAARFADDLGVWPIWSGLGARLDRLHDYLLRHADGYIGEPSGEERARLVERVAAMLHGTRHNDKNGWLEYFLQIPDFMGTEGELLGGLPVLFGDDGELHPAMLPTTEADRSSPSSRRRRVSKTAIFSPPDPRRADTDDDLEVEPPKKLSQRFGFLSTALPWHSDLASARAYLEKYRLVEEFDREAVLAHLSRTLRNERNKEVLRGGLRWAFHLWRQPRAGNRPFKLQPQHRFRVPTLDGRFIDAGDVLFSASWPSQTLGGLLQEFLDAAPSGIPDVSTLAGCRLAATDHPAFREKLIGDWVEFLTELGVGKGIRTERKTSKNNRFQASQISEFNFLEHYGIPRKFGGLWREDIKSLDSSLLTLPSTTEYVIKGDLYWLPGQSDIDSFSSTCRTLYARLILEWITGSPNLSWEFEIHHNSFWRADTRNWPTPLLAFLRSACWLPVEDTGQSESGPLGARPSDLWLNDADGEQFLPYLPRPVREVRRLFELAGTDLFQNLQQRAGLSILDTPETLVEQLAFLANHFGSEGFDEHFRPRLLNLYFRTWRKFLTFVDDSGQELGDTQVPVTILVQRYHTIQPVDMFDEDGEKDEIIYVCDTDRESDVGLLAASGRAFFQLKEGDPGRTGDLFEGFYGERIRLMSLVDYSLLADGKNIEGTEKVPALDICPYLRSMVAVSTEALSGTEAQRLPSDRSEILAKLDRINLAKAATLSFTIDGMSISQAQIASQAFHLTLENGQSVILVCSSEEWSWDLVDQCLPTICEALGQRALTPHLRLLLAHVSRDEPLGEVESYSGDDVGRLAELLRLSPPAVIAARAILSAGLERQAPWIKAVLHYFGGLAAAEALDEEHNETFRDPELLRDTLSKLLHGTPASADALLDIARTALGPKDFREGLGLEFAVFNASLTALGLDPDTHPDLHRWHLENFVKLKGLEITDCLRQSCLDRLNKMQPAYGYADARDGLRALAPDPTWLLQFKEPPEVVLEDFVNTWLDEHGAPPLGGKHIDLEPLAHVREQNRKFFPDFVQRAMSLIRAWRAKYQPSHDLNPSDVLGQGEALRKRLDDVGVLDCRTLDDISAAKWLRALEIWPADMPLSFDLEKLGLSLEDVKDERVKALEEREARKREARLVAFNGRKLDPTDVDLLVLSDELQQALSPNVLNKALGSSADLAQVKLGERSPELSSGRKGSKNGRRPRVPEEKTELIGRLGELIVYHWLRRILPSQDIDSAWLSENGAIISSPLTTRKPL